MIHYLSPLDKSNSYASYKPFKSQHQHASSPHCSSYGTAWEFFFCNATTFHLWIIISLILMTCLFDQAVLLLGEIGCASLLGLKGLMMAHRWSSTSLFPVPFCDSVLLVNPALILLPAFLRLQSTHLNGPLLLSHLCNIFVMWTSLCHLRTPRWLKHLPQCVHSKGFYVSSYCRLKLPRVKL